MVSIVAFIVVRRVVFAHQEPDVLWHLVRHRLAHMLALFMRGKHAGFLTARHLFIAARVPTPALLHRPILRLYKPFALMLVHFVVQPPGLLIYDLAHLRLRRHLKRVFIAVFAVAIFVLAHTVRRALLAHQQIPRLLRSELRELGVERRRQILGADALRPRFRALEGDAQFRRRALKRAKSVGRRRFSAARGAPKMQFK